MTTIQKTLAEKTVLIGGACAFVGDSILGPRQLVDVPGMQYLVFDYLAEMSLSSFAQARKTDPQAGFAREFIDVALPEIIVKCAARGIKLVANAGGLNPRACAQAIEALCRENRLELRVAHVEGDNVMAMVSDLKNRDERDFYNGAAMPDAVESANVYLGAIPIARALELGADIVVTGRIVDSATTLGILMHEFNWSSNDYDKLAGGSLAGHVLECGAQATGGLFTDWETVEGWENIGYPWALCKADGTFMVGKAEGTGGCVTPQTVAEQILYEVGDPSHYVLPDVVCDFTGVQVHRAGTNLVSVTGARGSPAPATYKLSASYQDGYRCVAQISVFGRDAVPKARRTCEALLKRTRSLLQQQGLGDFCKVSSTVIGAEDGYGPHAGDSSALREAIARLAVTHSSRQALDLFSRESRSPGVSFAPGTTGGSALTLNSRPAVEPRFRLFSCLVDKSALTAPTVHMGTSTWSVPIPTGGAAPVPYAPKRVRQETTTSDSATSASPTVPLWSIAHGRSGDKGDTSNIAVLARDPAHYAHLRSTVTVEKVEEYLGHLVSGTISRYDVPGLHAINFVLSEALDGGGPSSLRTDPMGKGMAQMLLDMQVPAVP